MKTRVELKNMAKENLSKGNFGIAIATVVLAGAISFLASFVINFIVGILTAILSAILFASDASTEIISGIGLSISFISYGISLAVIIFILPMAFGVTYSFLTLAKEGKTSINNLFIGYKKFLGSSILLYILTGLYIMLWSLLFYIPGIIKSLSYFLAPFILAENPNIGPNEAITLSRKMMDGHKAELFVLELSFIGWTLLATLTCGIGYLFLTPYMNLTFANFYLAVKEIYEQNNVITE